VALAAEVQEKQQSQEICAVSDAAKPTQAPIEDDDTPAPTKRDVRHFRRGAGAISDQRRSEARRKHTALNDRRSWQ
jgi:hypothetical protein